MKQWYETLAERQRAMREKNHSPAMPIPSNKVTKRRPYLWGAKGYLAGFTKGECRTYCGEFSWDSLRSIASKMKAEFGSQFLFNTIAGQRYITRVL